MAGGAADLLVVGWAAVLPGGPVAQPPPPPDQVALMCQRLQGFHLTGRKEAAYTLGQLGDPRAVPTLIHVLKNDNFKDVRIASAIALGEIGGSQAAIALERSAVYDHRDDVRRASCHGPRPIERQGEDGRVPRGAVARRGFAARGAAARRLATFAAVELVAFTVRQPAPGERTDAG